MYSRANSRGTNTTSVQKGQPSRVEEVELHSHVQASKHVHRSRTGSLRRAGNRARWPRVGLVPMLDPGLECRRAPEFRHTIGLYGYRVLPSPGTEFECRSNRTKSLLQEEGSRVEEGI